eukprot:scaffold12590_cov69-Skeletonema_dohrnii-CCMP3373.AAC.1
MAWSAELAAGASAWAKEKAKTCTTDGQVSGKYGQNSASQRLNSPDDARSEDEIVTWWAPTNVDEKSQYNNQFTAVMWRSSLYVGCASEIGQIENSKRVNRHREQNNSSLLDYYFRILSTERISPPPLLSNASRGSAKAVPEYIAYFWLVGAIRDANFQPTHDRESSPIFDTFAQLAVLL